MGYPCIPDWVKPIKRDPFKYKLRTPQEIHETMIKFPPCFPIEIVVVRDFDCESERGEDVRKDSTDQVVYFF